MPYRSPRLRLLVAALITAASLAVAGCKGPCGDLADRLCVAADGDESRCEAWKQRVGRVPSETCQAGIRLLDRERVR